MSDSNIFTTEEKETNTFTPLQPANDEIIELGDNFDFDGFQVVRREFFAHTKEPSVSFTNCKFYVNAACLSKFPDVDYVQALVNQDKKILALRPCTEYDRDAIMWCNETKGKKKAKQITCKLFFARIFTIMEWNPDHRYKLLGKVIHANGEYLIAFDLNSTEVYERTFNENNKPRTSRIPVFPEAWKNQFGMSYNEHRQSMQVDIFDGFAVYGIKDNTKKEADKPQENVAEENKVLYLPESTNGGVTE